MADLDKAQEQIEEIVTREIEAYQQAENLDMNDLKAVELLNKALSVCVERRSGRGVTDEHSKKSNEELLDAFK